MNRRERRRRGRRSAPHYQARLWYALTVLLMVAALGTLGYSLLERWSLLDSLYMTIITMTTVGYGETHPLSAGGRVFTMGLLVISIGIAGYAVSTLAAFIVEGEFYRIIRERRMDQQITKLKNHLILCGGGHTGMHIANEFYRTQTPFVLIEQDEDALQHVLELGDIPYVQGDATEDEVLRLAGIERARGLVAALGDDKANVFIVLTARALNPTLRIVSRVIEVANIEKLRKAGADEVVSSDMIGGLRMASVMLRPTVVSFLDEMLRVTDQTLRVEEIHLANVPHLIGKTLVEADLGRRTGMLVVAIKSPGSGYKFNPRANTLLQAGDILIVIGTPEQIRALHEEGG